MIPDPDLGALLEPSGGKLLLVVMDGLGGLPRPVDGRTELEVARTPNFDSLARRSACGLHTPVEVGVTPGSGPAHIGLFGYDPWRHRIGRGALSAAGVGFPLVPGDVAARANFCTLDDAGRITDRRAGRIATTECARLCAALEAEAARRNLGVFVKPEKDHRAAVVFRGEGLSDQVHDLDPQKTGVAPLAPRPSAEGDAPRRTSDRIARFMEMAGVLLRQERPANGILLRGFAHPPTIESVRERYGLAAACVAAYPMYKGLSSLVGMTILAAGDTLRTETEALKTHWSEFDFFFFHVKGTDSAGEDGDFDRKARVIEEVDRILPELGSLQPAALCVTGDHSTPSVMKGHSWHPVPVLLAAPNAFAGGAERFTERECAKGTLGRIRATDLMPLLLAHAGRMRKFGA